MKCCDLEERKWTDLPDYTTYTLRCIGNLDNRSVQNFEEAFFPILFYNIDKESKKD